MSNKNKSCGGLSDRVGVDFPLNGGNFTEKKYCFTIYENQINNKHMKNQEKNIEIELRGKFDGKITLKIPVESEVCNDTLAKSEVTSSTIGSPITEVHERSVMSEMINNTRTGFASEAGKVLLEWTTSNAPWGSSCRLCNLETS